MTLCHISVKVCVSTYRLAHYDFLTHLVRPSFSVHKVLLLDTWLVFVLLQVLAHLHMFWICLEISVSRRRRLVRLLQLKRERVMNYY